MNANIIRTYSAFDHQNSHPRTGTRMTEYQTLRWEFAQRWKNAIRLKPLKLEVSSFTTKADGRHPKTKLAELNRI
eukprot:scaffold4056_cov115-Cylindrotheca_fusiformis.AAC.1